MIVLSINIALLIEYQCLYTLRERERRERGERVRESEREERERRERVRESERGRVPIYITYLLVTV